MVRQSHQAKKPEKLTPKIRATPVRRPIDPSSPMVLNEGGCSGRSESAAAMLRATGDFEIAGGDLVKHRRKKEEVVAANEADFHLLHRQRRGKQFLQVERRIDPTETAP